VSSFPTSPATAVTGPLTAALLNSYKTNIDFLTNTSGTMPYCHAYLSGSQTLSAGVSAAITLDGEIKDTDSMHTGSNSFFTVNTAGLYLVIAEIQFPSTASGNDFVTILNGVNVMAGDNTGAIAASHRLQVTAFVQCAVSDTLSMKGLSTAGGALTAGSGATFLQAKWMCL